MNRLKPELVRQLFLILLILFLSVLIIEEMTPYLSGVLGAITLYVLLTNSVERLIKRGWKAGYAAGLAMLGSFVVILVPIGLTVMMLTNKIGKAVNNSERVIEVIKDQIGVWEADLGFKVSESIDTNSITSWVSTNLQNLAGGTFNVFIAVGIMYFILYYMLVNREKLHDYLYAFIPLGKDNIKRIGEESRAMVKSNALGIPLVALAQGIVALIGFFIFGVPDPFFWFVITAIGSMIPFVGTLLGIAPVVILMIASGNNLQALGIGIYGLVVVGSTDNLIRLYVLERLANVHPLVTLIGVIVGVPLFGFIGLIFGPLLISLFLLIVKIYKQEYGDPDTLLEKHQEEHVSEDTTD
ncbi:AI-2E family transporter [Leeuwenhoekiella nanhaiensis]|uniref:AI-2E family transporter n=1 Tax=Leeuwenhoekiella nanhaiensis TaxID=1655491 RepID=A0A2G1VSD3_9FLAO|nr:AI-2E family transporter [Leeuwenhoekiella nanhaiensis]PHQ29520.1 AI-2E family transporter [Leeuwenhoekiella nanhaiensis]